MKIGWKCIQKINISNAREALKANIDIESEVETRIRYTSKALESKCHCRIRGENANSLYKLSA